MSGLWMDESGPEQGTTPDGGTSGAVGAPTSGGEELARRHTRPLRGVHTSNCERFSPAAQTAEPTRQDARKMGLRERLCEKDGTPRTRCHPTVRLASYQA